MQKPGSCVCSAATLVKKNLHHFLVLIISDW